MATSVDDLFTRAHSAIWEAWPPGPVVPDPERAADQWREHLRAWPALASGAEHALRCAGQPPATPIGPLLTQIRRLAAAGDDGSTGPGSPHLIRAARLLAVGGDGLLLAHGQPPGTEATDKILTILGFAATATARSAWTGARTGDAEHWFRLAHSLHGARQLLTPTPSTPAMTRPIVPPHEHSLAADLHTFHQTAWAMLREPTAVPTRHLLQIPHALHMIHRLAAHPDPLDGHRDTADAWCHAALAWRDGVRIPGPANPDLTTAAHALAQTLTVGVTVRGASLLRDYGTDRARVLAAAYADRVHETVHAGLPVIAAKRLAPSGMRPLPLEVADAARAGRWVPLPLTSPPAQQILDATTAAATSQIYQGSQVRSPVPAAARGRDLPRRPPPGIPATPGSHHAIPR